MTTGFYDSPRKRLTEIPVGFGTPIDDPNLQPMAAQGTAVFAEAVRLVADALDVDLDEVVCEAEYAKTTEENVGSATSSRPYRRFTRSRPWSPHRRGS